ncbi:hypothetical protein Tco_0926608 [Tanacetum coccineum]|uniref:Uncharacterized protein n=1 Tax=Tanacetum coccineum TaxID=301880 RepID=A0ABQ5DH92_9ASTR
MAAGVVTVESVTRALNARPAGLELPPPAESGSSAVMSYVASRTLGWLVEDAVQPLALEGGSVMAGLGRNSCTTLIFNQVAPSVLWTSDFFNGITLESYDTLNLLGSLLSVSLTAVIRSIKFPSFTSSPTILLPMLGLEANLLHKFQPVSVTFEPTLTSCLPRIFLLVHPLQQTLAEYPTQDDEHFIYQQQQKRQQAGAENSVTSTAVKKTSLSFRGTPSSSRSSHHQEGTKQVEGQETFPQGSGQTKSGGWGLWAKKLVHTSGSSTYQAGLGAGLDTIGSSKFKGLSWRGWLETQAPGEDSLRGRVGEGEGGLSETGCCSGMGSWTEETRVESDGSRVPTAALPSSFMTSRPLSSSSCSSLPADHPPAAAMGKHGGCQGIWLSLPLDLISQNIFLRVKAYVV